MDKKFTKKNLGIVLGVILGIIVLLSTVILVTNVFKPKSETKNEKVNDAELARAMEYARVEEGEEKVQITNGAGEKENFGYVEFDAFFLRDLNGDGYAEGVRGTCKEIGKNDTLYMELNVLTKGYLKDGKITINGDRNFYFETAIVKDKEIKENYIGTDVNKIELNQINNGTQKLITGIVKSKIGTNINNYSKIGSVTLTGIHVEELEDGSTIETPIEKTVNFDIDWYGEVKCSIINLRQTKNLSDTINENAEEISLKFDIDLKETKEQLLKKTSSIKAEIPELNGYAPIRVEITNRIVTYEYDNQTRILTARSEGTVEEDGRIISYPISSYSINAVYPIEAYETIGEDTIHWDGPGEGHVEGVNDLISEV